MPGLLRLKWQNTWEPLHYAQHIRRWREAGYHVSLFFLSLPNPKMAIDRIAERVRQGGLDYVYRGT